MEYAPNLYTKEQFEEVYKDFLTIDKKEIVRESAKCKVEGFRIVILTTTGKYSLVLERETKYGENLG